MLTKPQIIRITKHILFWLSVLFYFVLFDYLIGGDPLLTCILSNGVFLPHDIVLTYVIIYLLIPNFFFRKKYLLFFLCLFGVLLANGFISFFIYNLVIDLPAFSIERRQTFDLIFKSNMSFVFVASLVLALKSIDINNNRLLLKEQSDSRFYKAQLALLRSQINPHFLFNTLNNINTLVFKDQQKSYDSIIMLSEIMRYMHEGQKTEFVPLEIELAYIKNYVELQKLRFKNAESVELNISGEKHHILVAPMIFIGFAENAFKHCNKKELIPAIMININSDGTSIQLSVKNYYDKKAISSAGLGGFGIENTKQRLELLYKNNHELSIEDQGNLYIVELKLGPIEGK